jgi:hypothetical protein
MSWLKSNKKKRWNVVLITTLISWRQYHPFVFLSQKDKLTQNGKSQLDISYVYRLQPNKYTSRKRPSMSERINLSLVTLPVEVIYRILDHQDDLTILCSMQNVCQRLNTILDSYHRYQVNFFFILNISFPSISIIYN